MEASPSHKRCFLGKQYMICTRRRSPLKRIYYAESMSMSSSQTPSVVLGVKRKRRRATCWSACHTVTEAHVGTHEGVKVLVPQAPPQTHSGQNQGQPCLRQAGKLPRHEAWETKTISIVTLISPLIFRWATPSWTADQARAIVLKPPL